MDSVTEEDTAEKFKEVTDYYGNTLTETTFADGEFGTVYRSYEYTSNCNCAENAGNDLIRKPIQGAIKPSIPWTQTHQETR